MLTGKVAMITGAAQGGGKAIATALAHEGATVAVADINQTAAEATATELRASGANAIGVKVDITNRAEVERAVDQIVSKFSRLDILVNNAGILIAMPTLELTDEHYQRHMDINLKGALLCSQEAARVMIPQGGGRIINVGSTAAHTAAAGALPYCVSKAGLLAMTRVLAVEWGKYNILVNSVCPGTLGAGAGQSAAAMSKYPERYERRQKRVPITRPMNPSDLAKAVLFFASDWSGYVTGQDLLVDGGILCLDPGAVE